MAEYPLNTLTTEAQSLDPARARRQPRAPRCPGKPLVERSTLGISSSDSEGCNGCAACFRRRQESDEGELDTGSATEAISNPYMQRTPRPKLTGKNHGRGGRGKNHAGDSARRLKCTGTTGYDNSHSRSDVGRNGCGGVDGRGRHNTTSNRQEGADHGVQDAGPVVSGSSTRQQAKKEDEVAVATAASTQAAGTIVPDVTRQTVLLSSTTEPLAFSKAVNPFSSYRLPERRSLFHRAISFTFLFPGKNVPCGIPLRFPAFFASGLSLIRDRAPFVPPALSIPVTFLLLFICVTLSVHVLPLLTPLPQVSFHLLTQFSSDKSPAQNNSTRYCEHSQPVRLKSLVSVKETLPLFPVPSQDLRRPAGRQADDCQPCPEHADCSGGRMTCSLPYVRVPAATATGNLFFATAIHVTNKLLRRELKDGDACVENVMARRTAEKVVERIVFLLKKRAGDAQCSSIKVCGKLSPAGHTCHELTESRKDFTKEERKGSKVLLSSPDGALTRWELLQSEELRRQLEDDSVYAYVFDWFLEEQAALRLNVEVRQQYSFESMRLPRENAAPTSAAKDHKEDGIVALFLREQRRSQGITYSYAYVGPDAIRSPFCVFRLVFMNTIVPLSFVITALSALAFPVAVWLRRFYLRRQLLIIMQQQQDEQQTLMRSHKTQEADFSPVVYCGCSSAHLSQLLVQKTSVHRFSLLRWWLQRTATKIEEVDAMCFELLYNKSACVQTVKHEEQNFWQVTKGISPIDEHTAAGSTTTSTTCPQMQARGQVQQIIEPLSLNSSQEACSLLQPPGNAADALLAPQLSTPCRLSCVSSLCPGAATHVGVCSCGVCGRSRTSFHLEGRGGIHHADAHVSAMHCSASTPGPWFAASTTDSSALFRESSRAQRPSCISSTVGSSSPRPFSSHVASSQSATQQATGSGWSVEADKVCLHGNNNGCQAEGLHLPQGCAGWRRSSTSLSADYSFSAFLARVSDIQQKTPA